MTTVFGDMQKLEPGAEIVLFKLDGSDIGAGSEHFHGYRQMGSIFWQGNEYSPWPITASGFGRTSDKPPTPTLVVGNIEGSISALCMLYQDMVGAKIVVKKTFGKYLDAENWPDTPLSIIAVGGVVTDAWTIAAGVVERNSAPAGYARVPHDVLDPLKTYRMTFDVSSFSGDETKVFVGGTIISPNLTINSNGAKVIDIDPGEAGLLGYVQFEPDGFLGAGEIRIENFTLVEVGPGNPTADPDQHFPDEIWYIERKANEDYEAVMFELATAMDFNGVNLPRRQIVGNFCHAIVNGGYRGPYCGYVGGPVALRDDTPTADPDLDRCGGRLSSCKLRFGQYGKLPFGAFPAAGLIRT